MNSCKRSSESSDRRRPGSPDGFDSAAGPAESRLKSKEELLAGAYAAFNARDIGAVLAMMHPEVDWPNGMEGGRVHGHSGVREYWVRQWAILDPHVEPIRFGTDESGLTTVDVHQVIRDLTGTVVSDQIVQHVYTMQENLIQGMDIKKARD